MLQCIEVEKPLNLVVGVDEFALCMRGLASNEGSA